MTEENEQDLMTTREEEIEGTCDHQQQSASSSAGRAQEKEGDQCPAALDFVDSLKRSMTRPVLLGIVSLYGKVRYTLDHYEHLVEMMKDGREEDEGATLPSATTMRKSIFPRILKNLLVGSSIEKFPAKPGFSSYINTSSKLTRRQTEAVVVLPSAWARMDVRSLHVLREMACVAECRCGRKFGTSDLRVDTSNHVVEREEITRHSDTLWINKDGVPAPSSAGMVIKLHTFNGDIVQKIQQASTLFTSELVHYRKELCTSFDATILSTIHVSYSSTKGLYLEGKCTAPLDEESKAAYNSCIRFVEKLCRRHHLNPSEIISDDINGTNTYIQSTDHPQTRRQRHRQHPRVDGRLESKEPYLVPSDHITIVRLGESSALGVFVSRFWVQRLDDERNFFLFLEHNDDGSVSSTPISTIGAPVFVKDNSISIASTRARQQC